MATTVADIPPDKMSELASYLDDFCPSSNSYDDDSEQYWYLLAVSLRALKTLGEEYKYDEHVRLCCCMCLSVSCNPVAVHILL